MALDSFNSDNLDLSSVPDELLLVVVDILEEGQALAVQNCILLARIDLGRGELGKCSSLLEQLRSIMNQTHFAALIDWLGFLEIEGQFWLNGEGAAIEVCGRMDRFATMLQPGIYKADF